MKEWSELEDRYQQMMSTDPTSAQTFRQRMTAKFQANIQVSPSNIFGLLQMGHILTSTCDMIVEISRIALNAQEFSGV